MKLRIFVWAVTIVLTFVAFLGIASVGLLVAPFALVSLAIAVALDLRYAEPVPVGRLFGIIALLLAALGFGARAIDEFHANECGGALAYACTDSKSEYVLALISIACAMGAIALMSSWIRSSAAPQSR